MASFIGRRRFLVTLGGPKGDSGSLPEKNTHIAPYVRGVEASSRGRDAARDCSFNIDHSTTKTRYAAEANRGCCFSGRGRESLRPVFLKRIQNGLINCHMHNGKQDWTRAALAAHANVRFDDCLLFDVAKPITDTTHLEIEISTLDGQPYSTGGGRTVDANVIDIMLESARRRSCSRFFADPLQEGAAETVVEHEQLTGQFSGDAHALDRLDVLVEQLVQAAPARHAQRWFKPRSRPWRIVLPMQGIFSQKRSASARRQSTSGACR